MSVRFYRRGIVGEQTPLLRIEPFE